jgi:hypothetical protein
VAPRRPRRAATARVVAAALTAALGGAALAACSSGDDRADDRGGMNLPAQRDGESYPGARGPVAGTVARQPNGCFRLATPTGTRLVVWPRGSGQDPQDGAVIRLASGRRLHDGDRVSGTGLEFPVTGLAGVPDGYWGGGWSPSARPGT